MRFLNGLALTFAIAVMIVGGTAHAEDGPFDQGRVRISVALGATSSFGETYFVIGAGLGYFVLPGLEIGAQFDQWLGGDPNVTRIAPELRYVIDVVDVVKPYVGGFYRHWYIGSGAIDYDTVGARAGLIFVQGPHAYVSAGAVYERVISQCEADCSYWYPEVGVAFMF